MKRRIFGIETEFGCLVHDPSLGTPEAVVEAVKNRIFNDERLGVIDLHARDYTFEPARAGGHRLNRTDFRNNVMRLGDHEVDYIWVHNFYGVEIDQSVEYQLSQRADHIRKTVASKVRFNRAIINPKWETYYNFSNMHRLHLLFGEANMMEYATALKIGTTSLVLDLVEEGLAPVDVCLDDAVRTLQSVSRDATWRWLVKRIDGRTIPAVDMQRLFLEAAQRHLSGRDVETDWILREWEYVLAGLELDPRSLADRVDWVAKRRLLEMYMEAEEVAWDADVLQSLDLEYHNLNPETSLSHGLVLAGQTEQILD